MPIASATSKTPDTERSTLYFDALSSPAESNDDKNPLDAVVANSNQPTMNHTSNAAVNSYNAPDGFMIPPAPGSVLPSAIPHDGTEEMVSENPFGSQNQGAESPGWLPAIDGDETTVANTQRNAYAGGDSGINSASQRSARSNSVRMPPPRPPVPMRPASFHSATYGNPAAAGAVGNGAAIPRGNSIASSIGRPSGMTGAPNGAQQQAYNTDDSSFLNGHPPSAVALNDPGVVSSSVNGAQTANGRARDSLHLRDQSADSALTPKQKTKIDKVQRKETKKLSNIIKQEGKVEKQALASQIHELEELQKLQKAAVKRESAAHTKHTSLANSFQKLSQKYFAVRTKYEAQQAQLLAEEADLEDARQGVKEVMEKIKEKKEEVEMNRMRVGVEDKEREVKLGALSSSIRGDRKSIWK